MDMFIHYTALPEGMTLGEVVEGLNQVMDDGGEVNNVVTTAAGGRIDMELEEETHNPKLAQGAVKSFVMRVGFPQDTIIELGGMKINAYY